MTPKETEGLIRFAHESEERFARLLDFYGIEWLYEPVTFVLKEDKGGALREAFSPDFYLPAWDVYIEITTLRQKLVTKKNRKVKKLKELYPEINIRILYQRDCEMLARKYAALTQDPLNLKRSLIHQVHTKLNAKMAEFGGWEMPLSYPEGTLAEHKACRESVALFDVSHLARLEVTNASASLQWLFANNVEKLAEGDAQYTLMLDERGAVLEDLIIARTEPEKHLLIVNAANVEVVMAVLQSQGAKPKNITSEGVFLAIQGPKARECLAQVLSPKSKAAQVKRFGCQSFKFEGVKGLVLGTGYTGEDGIECVIPKDSAAVFFQRLAAAGAVPAGLGARDLLRLEAGLCLYGNELFKEITPLEAQLDWVVDYTKSDFRGKEALLKLKQAAPSRLLRGIVIEDRRPLRAGAEIYFQETKIGEITSGNFSPSLQKAVGLGYIDSKFTEGDLVILKQGSQAERTGLIVKSNFLATRR